MRITLAPLVLAASVALAGCADSDSAPRPEETTVDHNRPSLSEAATNLESAMDALRGVLDEVIPPHAWEAESDSFQTGCESPTQGQHVAPHYRAPGTQLPQGVWTAVDQTLSSHGFRPSSTPPADGTIAITRFSNEFGDQITVTSVADGPDGTGRGSSYFGETTCHEGYVRRTDR